MDKELLRKVTNQLKDANDAMGKAIDNAAMELTNNGNGIILFDEKIDSASVDPLVKLEYNDEKKHAYAVSIPQDDFYMNELTANELYDICNCLMFGNYNLVDLT